MNKKTRAKMLITGYEDPVNGCTCDIKYDGEEAEVVAILFRCAVTICNKDLHMANDQIIDMFTHCVSLGDNHG